MSIFSTPPEVKRVKQARRRFKNRRSELKKLLKVEPDKVDRSLIEEYLSEEGCGNLLELLPETLRADRALVKIAVASPDLEVVQRDARHTPFSAPVNSPLKHASPVLKQDRELVQYAISECADAYDFASEDLQADNELHFLALNQNRIQSQNFDARWPGPLFPEDNLAMYEYIGDYYYHVYNVDEDANPYFCYSDVEFDEIDTEYGKCLPEMLADWRVMCRILSGDYWEWDHLLSGSRESFQGHLLNNLPHSLFGSYQSDNVETYKVTNKEFVLFAIKEGFPRVIEHASEALKNDEEIKNLLGSKQ